MSPPDWGHLAGTPTSSLQPGASSAVIQLVSQGPTWEQTWEQTLDFGVKRPEFQFSHLSDGNSKSYVSQVMI